MLPELKESNTDETEPYQLHPNNDAVASIQAEICNDDRDLMVEESANSTVDLIHAALEASIARSEWMKVRNAIDILTLAQFITGIKGSSLHVLTDEESEFVCVEHLRGIVIPRCVELKTDIVNPGRVSLKSVRGGPEHENDCSTTEIPALERSAARGDAHDLHDASIDTDGSTRAKNCERSEVPTVAKSIKGVLKSGLVAPTGNSIKPT